MFKPVFQEIYHPTRGDCHRASMASIFGLELCQVPHFVLFPEDREKYIVSGFYWGMGYDWIGCGKPEKDKLKVEHSINGLFMASVLNNSPIRSHGAHSVIIDLNGICIHDPDKRQAWKGINIMETGDLQWWVQTKKRLIDG